MDNAHENTGGQNRNTSLSAKTARAAVISAGILMLVALVIGLSIYTGAVVRRYTRQAFDMATYARMAIMNVPQDPVMLAEDTLEVYHGMTEEERMQTGTEEYRDRFEEVMVKHRDVLAVDYRILVHFFNSGEVYDVYMAMYDESTGALIYLIDPQAEAHFALGEWEPAEPREMQKYLSWDEQGELYDISHTKKYGWMCTAGVPIRNENSEIACFIMVDVTLQNVLADMLDYTVKITLALAAAIAAIIWFLLKYIRQKMVRPVNQIAEAAQSYAENKKKGETGHFSALDIHTGDELENLSRILADMETELTEQEDHIRRITAEKERVGTELRMARQIQGASLPHEFPPFPDRTEFEIYASMDPAREVGGDFYDFFLVDEDHLGLLIADVSGKGVPAALFMMVSKAILKSSAMLSPSPAEVLQKTNEALCANNQTGMFVTVWAGILEISTGRVVAANAGHEYPAIFRAAEGSFTLLEDKHSFVVGGIETAKYAEYELILEPGDKLFLYTDGVPEASEKDEQMYGLDRMLKALNRDPLAGPEQILKNIQNDVEAFVCGAEQFDDLTMLCLEYKGAAHETAEEPLQETEK